MKYTVRKATLHDAKVMASRMRHEDTREIKAAVGRDSADVLSDCVSQGRNYVIEVDGTLLALFGVHDATDFLAGAGVPWMVATPDLVRHQMWFLRNTKTLLEIFIYPGFTRLINCADIRNEVHLRWLKWCGFTFTQIHPEWGVERRPFVQFEKHINVRTD